MALARLFVLELSAVMIIQTTQIIRIVLLLILLISYFGLGYVYLHYPTLPVKESRVYLYESTPTKP